MYFCTEALLLEIGNTFNRVHFLLFVVFYHLFISAWIGMIGRCCEGGHSSEEMNITEGAASEIIIRWHSYIEDKAKSRQISLERSE